MKKLSNSHSLQVNGTLFSFLFTLLNFNCSAFKILNQNSQKLPQQKIYSFVSPRAKQKYKKKNWNGESGVRCYKN